MDPIVWVVLGVVLILSVWRLGRTYRSARRNRGDDIQERLARLRKKRDEE